MLKKSLLLLSLLLIACSDNTEYQVVETEVINGVISDKYQGHVGRIPNSPMIYIQTPRKTFEVAIPFKDVNQFNIGDSIMVIVQLVERKQNK